jgi:hypothetical protein
MIIRRRLKAGNVGAKLFDWIAVLGPIGEHKPNYVRAADAERSRRFLLHKRPTALKGRFSRVDPPVRSIPSCTSQYVSGAASAPEHYPDEFRTGQSDRLA